jgi:hypothetical protein
MIQVQVCGRQRQRRPDYNNTSTFFSKKKVELKNEIEDKIPKYGITNRTNKRFKHRKPYWNEELQTLWNSMRIAEKEFLK